MKEGLDAIYADKEWGKSNAMNKNRIECRENIKICW